jgi:cell surface protein SprA
LTSITSPIWNLMMKNIYQIPGAYQLEKEDFKFNILYSDPSPLNYITPVSGEPFPPNPTIDNRLAETTLLKVFNVDKLNFNNDPQAGGDGFFDFMPGLTVDTQNGRLIFTTKEPFGELLFNKLTSDPTIQKYNDPLTYNLNQKKYVFQNLYRKSQASALQESQKNKFQLKGKFKSSGGDGIPIGAFNVPKGSVVVTAGGRVLQEGVDYSVNYQAGRVQILDPSLKASNTPIQVSVENNSVFGQQTRRFMGINVEHKFSENFVLGATYLNLSERPLTQKSTYGQESVNNSIFGLNTNFSTEVPFFTRLANKLPNMDTDAPSNLSVRGEVAYLKPGTPKADQFDGESTIYVDDFEGSQSTIDLRSPQAWSLSSTPIKEPLKGSYPDFNGGSISNDLSYGFKRSKLSWYTIDPSLYSQRPSGVTVDDVSSNKTRRVLSSELYPNTNIATGQSLVLNTLDLTYYPKERGPYNNNPVASNVTPKDNFGGITRALNSTNFEQSNVEYIQFWVMDPYIGTGAIPGANTGKVYFNLGAISEDILRDGKKQFENGLPSSGINNQLTTNTIWGKVPQAQSLLYAFDTDTANRSLQDVGFDGLSDAEEAAKYNNFAGSPDPAGDNYQYYLEANGNILNRYKNYNGMQGNSPVDVTDNNRGNSTTPDVEDLNRDNTMDEINAYYEYGIDIKPNMVVGQNFITDITPLIKIDASEVPNGVETEVRWIQFKIPVSKPESTIGGISDFRSIRFMRMFMTGFEDEITLRFGALDLVRGEWRRYNNSLDADLTDLDPENDGTDFDIEAVNIEENAPRYVSPPGVEREQLYNNNTVINQNEQSLALRVKGVNGLEAGDSRAAFKNISVDMRQFKNLKMFLHAESVDTTKPLLDNEMTGFVRLGNDFTENFYQIEMPLKVSANNANTATEIWPSENSINLALSQLTQLKIQSKGLVLAPGEIYYAPTDPNTKLKIGVRGNPNLGLVRTLMVGLKNNKERISGNPTANTIKGEVWFNELRLSDQDNNGGLAAILNIDTNIADFATLSATGKLSTIGFGTIEQGPNERSREDIQQYNIVTNLSLGKLLPKKWGINLPFNYSVGEEKITPQYDPFSQDILLKQLIDVTADQKEKNNILDRAIDYTKRQSINFIGVKKERGEKQKPHIYDPENLTLSYSYNKEERHNFEIERYTDQQVTTTADYSYSFQPKAIEPFKKSKFFKKSSYWKLLSEFNFNYLPSSINFSTNINRQYNKQQFRQVEVIGLPLDALYRRNFIFNYNYGFNYNVTKSLKVNFTASSSNIVRNYLNANNEPNNEVTIWDDYLNAGDPNLHNQQLAVNYELPFNKIPFLSFLKSSYTYTGDYSWQKASESLSNIEISGRNYNLGNTIQNAGSHKLNATLAMDSFYKYVGLTKGAKKPNAPKPVAPKPGQKVENKAVVPESSNSVFKDGLIGLLTSVKNIQGNYTENRGTVLPGYTPGIGFFGTSKPTLGFVFGSQDEVRFEAAKRGYLTDYKEFNQNFTQISSKTLNFTANMDLFPDFKIDLTADRTYATNYSEQYDVSNDGTYNSRSPYTTGNFAISTTMLKTAFKTSDESQSSPFEDFKNNRIIVANRLAAQNGVDVNNIANIDADGFPKGYGKNSQAVLIPSFLAAYTGLISSTKGEDAKGVSFNAFRNIPIPNMTIKYSGLMRYKAFKDKFKRFSLQSAYKASYTINSFRSNLDYDKNPGGIDAGGNLLNKTLIQNINLVEQFSPLLRIDMELKSSIKILAEMKKDRALSMSFDNNLLTEVKGIEYIVGLGYRIKDVTFSTKLADNPTGIIKSDINIKADISYRNSQTIVRNLDYNNNQLSGGQNIWSAKLTADYSLSKNFTAIFFYDHSFSKAVISTSFPITNIRSGITLRYNFGN